MASEAVADAPPASWPASPVVRRVLLVSIDGLRPDLILRARAPAFRGLMERGSFSLWATTTASSVTLPAHASMLTGVSPEKHGIEGNSDLLLAHPVYPARPTLFEIAKGAGYTTAMASGKAKFAILAKPGTLNWSFVPDGTVSDSVVTDSALRWIRVHRPQVLFVHLPGVDVVGHAQGWGSDAQLVAVSIADRCVGRLLAALGSRRLLDSTVVLVTADHGGAGRSHGPDDPRSREIPWIIAGPGVRRGLDLTTDAALAIRTEDTFATLCALLGLRPGPDIDGHAVTSILDAGRVAR